MRIDTACHGMVAETQTKILELEANLQAELSEYGKLHGNYVFEWEALQDPTEGIERWPGKFGQSGKWIFCLIAAQIAAD
jgi:hypothetical protein